MPYRIAMIATVFVAATACIQRQVELPPYADPQVLFDSALTAYRQGECGWTRDAFARLSFELDARDPLQPDTRYYVGECMLRKGERLEATRQFRRVAEEYPRHMLAPDALLRSGDAYASLWNDPDLDPTYGEAAVATYRELLARYPASPAAERAQLRIAALEERFAEKEFKGGIFYLRLGAYDSAIIYFKEVVAQYARTSYAPQAVMKLIEAYDKIGYVEEKREMCQYLWQYYPDEEGAPQACPEQFATP
ncbi:MAG: outer membrane protein assembly factor BamD [Gemmatimonadota bacterium]|nr:MAG: outer membrane protein assembly factor BamD [Gemmatimonadota bacterium]